MPIDLPRFHLAHLPTPLEFLPRLSRELGPRIYVKRDDQTGLAGGGNKTRKLEFLVADALAQKADVLITVGAVQSNHCRQTAAAAAKAGLRCLLVLRGDEPKETTGNLLLDHLLGAKVLWAGKRSREEVMAEVADEERAAGRKPYPVPLGGSTPLGAAAYALAMEELKAQMEAQTLNFDRILFASSSGGTHAGLVVGQQITGFRGEVLGVSVDEDRETLTSTVARIATGTASLLGQPRAYAPQDISANVDYLGAGYAIMGEPEREAIELFAQTEGVLVDPVYTGRAAAGMIDLIRRGVIRIGETILFWHTGGTPALYAYEEQLTE
ncbi:MAG TPA: D-cysteine desulfhydrase family protein [Anaerolineales bacterium]|nr:D-cysteine desulfhydrase family protein [Anaerolineales bacterium]